MTTSDFIRHLKTAVENGAHAPSLRLLVVPDGQDVEDGCGKVLALLRKEGLRTYLIPPSEMGDGPRRWVANASTVAADAYAAIMNEDKPLLAAALAQTYNGQREELSHMPGPLLLFLSGRNEQVLRDRAGDFFSWGHVMVVPPLPELRSLLAAVAPGTLATPPPSQGPIRFLHLSDIHLNATDSYDQHRVQRGLIQLFRAAGAPGPLDFICLTGDLARRGQKADYRLVVQWIDELLDATRVQKDRLFLVPGNHDVDRNQGRFLLRTLAPVQEDYSAQERDSARQLADEFFLASLTERARWHGAKFADYDAMLRGHMGGRPLGLETGVKAVEKFAVRGTEIAIAGFNSAWFAQDDDDRQQLWLGSANVGSAADYVDLLRRDARVQVALALFHHPTDWLHPLDRTPVEQHLERSFDIVLRGHLHEAKADLRITKRSGNVEAAAAAAYQTSAWPNGCFIGELVPDQRTLTLTAYRYVSGADPWVVDTAAFPPDGRFRVEWPLKLQPLARDEEDQLYRAYWALDGSERDAISGSLGPQPPLAGTGRLRAHEETWEQLHRAGRLRELYELLRRSQRL